MAGQRKNPTTGAVTVLKPTRRQTPVGDPQADAQPEGEAELLLKDASLKTS